MSSRSRHGRTARSTNVIDTPELAIITNIGLDHTRELGPTIPDIARAKAGIIKPGGDVLIYDQNAEADAVFEETCHKMGARLTVTDHARIANVSHSLDALTFDCAPYGRLTCGLVGSYQTHKRRGRDYGGRTAPKERLADFHRRAENRACRRALAGKV